MRPKGGTGERLRALGFRLAGVSGLHWLGKVTPLLRCARAISARPPWHRLRFLAREAAGRGSGVYRLGATGQAIVVRHRTTDLLTLDEVVAREEYEPPEGAAEALEALPPAPRVADLGANIGLFGLWAFARWPEARVDAFEPDPANAAVHDRAIAANGLGGRWRLVRAAASAADGQVSFEAGAFAVSRVLEDGTGVRVPAVDVLERIAGADMVKIDIEGGEWELLADPRFRTLAAPVVVLEYHPWRAPGDDPAAIAERALREAGYEVRRARGKEVDGAGLLWGWRDPSGDDG